MKQATDFNRTVYVVIKGNDGNFEIEEYTYLEVIRNSKKEFTSPEGVMGVYFVRNNSLMRWDTGKHFPTTVETFETEQQAENALYHTYEIDYYKDSDALTYFETEAEAQELVNERNA